MGSFFVGGRRVRVTGRPSRTVSYSPALTTEYDPNGSFLIESAYVQYFVPSHQRFATPLLLAHGGGLTGAQWEDTPDGRPGWLMRFLEARIAVYVIDNIERGRAGFCAIEGEWPDQPVIRSDEEAARFYRFAFAGHQFPLASMDALSAQTVPRWPSTAALQREAIGAALKRIGPAVLLGFSQGGGLVFQAADRNHAMVRACIGVEPHGLPTEFAPGLAGTPALMVLGDFIDADEYWRGMAARGRASLDAWRQAGGLAETLELPALGIRGNTHMMMMDRNSDAVVQSLIDWLDRQHGEGRVP
jgi:pimeloyl-ACP methyl ester carboxylesterase